jgi:hypothetical protein
MVKPALYSIWMALSDMLGNVCGIYNFFSSFKCKRTRLVNLTDTILCYFWLLIFFTFLQIRCKKSYFTQLASLAFKHIFSARPFHSLANKVLNEKPRCFSNVVLIPIPEGGLYTAWPVIISLIFSSLKSLLFHKLSSYVHICMHSDKPYEFLWHSWLYCNLNIW